MIGADISVHRMPELPAGGDLAHASADVHRLECRLRRIEGQIRGIQHMVESGRGCGEVLTQIAAVRGALDGLAAQIVEQEVRRCLLDATDATSPPSDDAVAEIARAIGRLTRTP